ncbi:MAG: hypothetical protein C0402_00595 [Thermodesulfovibrio sp.]|nr:hypothetical protein [Thermodesulfovibrio sp.]
MLRNRYLIAGLCVLLLAVLGWNIRFFSGRRAVPGRQTGMPVSLSAPALSSAPVAGRQKTEAPAKRDFPVQQDAAVWRRDPFTLRPQAPAIRKPVVVTDALTKEDTVELQGIVVSGGKRFALVNGRVVGEGELVRDYRVAAINQYSIVLKGERGIREVSIIHETAKEK